MRLFSSKITVELSSGGETEIRFRLLVFGPLDMVFSRLSVER